MSDPQHDQEIPRIERPGSRSIPAHRYTDPVFLESEKTAVFRNSWFAACGVWKLRTPGSFATFDEAGIHLLLTRDASGTLHGFLNTCAHRGSRVAKGCGKATALTCPYHGWTYGLDGAVRSVPDAGGFGEVQVHTLGLPKVQVAQMGGMVWVNLDAEAEPLQAHSRGIAEALAPYGLDEMQPIEERVFTIPVNWKSMLENALDFYHVSQVHRHTIHAHVDTVPSMAIHGDHLRQSLPIAAYGWRDRLDARCTRGGPYSEAQRTHLFKYTLFPNTMLNVLPYHLTVMRFWPDGVGKTRLHYAFCRRRGGGMVEAARAVATWIASRVILAEDVRMLERCQQDLDVTAVPAHRLHDHEAAAAHFHRVLGRRIGAE